jgi:hypothetical protein
VCRRAGQVFAGSSLDNRIGVIAHSLGGYAGSVALYGVVQDASSVEFNLVPSSLPPARLNGRRDATSHRPQRATSA